MSLSDFLVLYIMAFLADLIWTFQELVPMLRSMGIMAVITFPSSKGRMNKLDFLNLLFLGMAGEAEVAPFLDQRKFNV